MNRVVLQSGKLSVVFFFNHKYKEIKTLHCIYCLCMYTNKENAVFPRDIHLYISMRNKFSSQDASFISLLNFHWLFVLLQNKAVTLLRLPNYLTFVLSGCIQLYDK